jgi:hypothetical protein
MTPGAPSPWCRRATPTSGRYDPAVRKTPLERWWTPLNICLGAALLVVALWYTSLLGPIVDPQVVIGATVGIIAMSAVGIRLYLASFKPLDPERPSSARLAALVDEAIALTGGARPRLALDESRLAKAVPNVGDDPVHRATGGRSRGGALRDQQPAWRRPPRAGPSPP